MSAPPFFIDTPNKIGKGIKVSGKNTLIKTDGGNTYRGAITDKRIDAKVDGTIFFCIRIDNAGSDSAMMFGFTPMESFDSKKEARFGTNGFTGCGIDLYSGNLYYPCTGHNIIDKEICKKSTEIIVILTISDNGTKKEIRFLVDGKKSKSTDVSEHLNGDRLFPAICLASENQQVTTIPIEQMKTRTPEIDKLVNEQKGFPFLRFVSVSDFFLQKCPLLQQHEELGRKFLQQREILFRGLTARMKLEVANSGELEVEAKQ
jgi:hypothetical protein